MIKKIAVLTSGGDAPGMNAALYTICRTALEYGISVLGVRDGFLGLYRSYFQPLSLLDLELAFNQGGTCLGTARFPAFKEPEMIEKSLSHLKANDIQALIVIGGEGSYRGAQQLSVRGIPVICLPGTIDNDVPRTEYAIGFFTALETAMSAIDSLQTTSSSHQRISIVELMGRCCSDLTVYAGIAGRCATVIYPGIPFAQERVFEHIQRLLADGRRHIVLGITEKICDVHALAEYIEQKTGRETRATVLGHVQRGGTPVAYDRILASRLGRFAIEIVRENKGSQALGIIQNRMQAFHLDQIFSEKKRGVSSELRALLSHNVMT